jgi:hypothetical protein
MKGNPDELIGELQAAEWVHFEIRRYVEQSRPLLVGAGNDAGFFFTTAGGEPISTGTLHADLRLVLGYPPFGERDIFLASALAHGASDEDVAIVLRTTVHTVNGRHETLPPVKGQSATEVHDRLLNGAGKPKRK